MNAFETTAKLVELPGGELAASRSYSARQDDSKIKDWEAYTGSKNIYRELPWEFEEKKELSSVKRSGQIDPSDIFTGSGNNGDALTISNGGVAWGTSLPTNAEQYQPLCWDGSKWAAMWLRLV